MQKVITLTSLLLLSLLLTTPIDTATVSPIFQTTISSVYEASSKVLATSSLTTSGATSSQSTTITYSNTYFSTPSFGYGISYISGTWTQTSGAIETTIDVSSSASAQTSQTLLLSFTTGTVTNFRVNYLVCLPNSFFFLDVQHSYQDLSSDPAIFTSGTTSSRQKTLTLPYKTKSNSSNSVVVYNTVGLSMMRQSHTF